MPYYWHIREAKPAAILAAVVADDTVADDDSIARRRNRYERKSLRYLMIILNIIIRRHLLKSTSLTQTLSSEDEAGNFRIDILKCHQCHRRVRRRQWPASGERCLVEAL